LERGAIMTLRRGEGRPRDMRDETVSAVRKVMEQRMSGEASFRDEVEAIAEDLHVLEERVIRVRNLGGVFGRVEMSPYVREMLTEVVKAQPV